MKRLVGILLVAVVVLGAMFWPALASSLTDSGSTDFDTATITNYRADYNVASDGTLKAVETITTQMPSGKHGIYRFWDVADPSDAHVRYWPKDIEVSVDGQPATVGYSWASQHRERVAKIGDADRTLSQGQHVYRISYRIDGVLAPGSSSDASQFYWNVVPGGWQMSITKSLSHVHLPSAATSLQCAVSTESTPCEAARGNGTKDLTIRTGALGPRTPVTIKSALDMPAPDQRTLPWPIGFDAVFGRNILVPVVLLVLAALAAAVGGLLAWRTMERVPGLPLTYSPPDGIGPVQGAYIIREAVPDKALTATLLYQAEQKLTKLTRTDEKEWLVEGIGTAEQWAATDPVTRAIGKKLGVDEPGGSFAADGSVSAGTTLESAKGKIGSTTAAWGRKAGLMQSSVPGSIGRVLVFLSIVLAGLLFFFHPFDVSMLGLPPAAFVVVGFPLVLTGSSTLRTASGRDLWSRAGGFRRVLSTPSSVERFNFSGRKELYTAFIPWAVAFDCAKAWEKKYETEMNQAAPSPLWFYGPYAAGGLSTGAGAIDSFESSLQSSISAYQATQSSSSSSGGGGFSGGGGGGGGGGGSW